MSQVLKWFDRKFDLTFPVQLYPNILVRLRGTPARLEELAGACSGKVLMRQYDGTWSMQENAGHLADLEALWLARVEDYISGVETLRAADLSNRKTSEANHNSRNIRDILKEFRAARASLLERTDLLNAEMYSRTALHPRLKTPMRLIDHLYFVAEHDDQHLARIWELGRIS